MSPARNAPALDSAARLGALAVLFAGALALGVSHLLDPGVCGLTLVLIAGVGLVLPRWYPDLVSESPQRTGLALLALVLLIPATAASGPNALLTGSQDSGLGSAIGALDLPARMPVGLLAALAAGALVAVGLELGEQRGAQSALVLGVAVTGLSTVAGGGRDLVPALILGWPAALFTLTRLAAGTTTPAGTMRPVGGTPPTTTGSRTTSRVRRHPGLTRPMIRWTWLPVLGAIMISCTLLVGAVLSGVAADTVLPGNWAANDQGGSSGSGRSLSDYLGGQMDLTARGGLDGQPLFSVPAGSPRLWRSGTLSEYTGRGWLANSPDGGPATLTSGSPGEITVNQPPDSVTQQGRPVQVNQVRQLEPGATPVLAPGRLLSLTAPDLLLTSVFSTAGDGVVLVASAGEEPEYQVHSQPLLDVDDPTDAAQLQAPDLDPATPGRTDPSSGNTDTSSGGVNPQYTALPAMVTQRTRQLGVQLVTAAPSRLAAVRAVERELDRRMTYNLDSPVPPRGVDAVDNVLFTSHSGFCEQFATAEVVLLRAARVPARVAVGFSGGDPASDGFRTVLRSDAHAWVEVWFPGIGWVDSDPTPAATAPTAGRWASIRAWAGSLVRAPGTWMALALVLAFVVLTSWRRRRGAVPAVSSVGRQLDPDLAAAFDRLEAVWTSQGHGREPGETLAALAARSQAALPRAALAVLEQALYSPRPPGRTECLTAIAAIEDAVREAQSPVAPSTASGPGSARARVSS